MQIIAIHHIAEVMPGDNLCELLLKAIAATGESLVDGDILVLAQKIVSKAEDRYAYLDEVQASDEAQRYGSLCHKSPELTQLILDESEEVLRTRPGVIIVQHKKGYVHANAGIDRSNLLHSERERVLLLPEDSDASAYSLLQELSSKTAKQLGVLINDSAGRAWRVGTAGMAIGTAGFTPVVDLIGQEDRSGRIMEVSQVAVADELAAAASLVMGQAGESIPAVIIRHAPVSLLTSDESECGSTALIRDKAMDMFR